MEKAFPVDVPRLLKFGKFLAGTAANIIAEEAKLTGTLRAFDNGVFSDLQSGLADAARGVEAQWGVSVGLDYSPSYPPLINDPALYRRAAAQLEGFSYRELPRPTMLSEDFSYYLDHVPACSFKLGLGTGVPLHTPEFDFDEKALVTGAER
jgi:hippurate hydrolase